MADSSSGTGNVQDVPVIFYQNARKLVKTLFSGPVERTTDLTWGGQNGTIWAVKKRKISTTDWNTLTIFKIHKLILILKEITHW